MEIVSPEQLLLKIAPILRKLGVRYCITGGFALAIWGEIRATNDIDIIVKLATANVAPLAKDLREAFPAGYIEEEAAREAIRNKGEFNFIDPGSGFKVDFWIMKDDTRTAVEVSRRVAEKIAGQEIYFISAEDLILNKLQWHHQTQSELQLRDVQGILRRSGEGLDMEYLKQWAEKLGVGKILKTLL